MRLSGLAKDERPFPNAFEFAGIERLIGEADSVLQQEDGPAMRQESGNLLGQVLEGGDVENGKRRRRSCHCFVLCCFFFGFCL